jgi:hypothetical protein
MRYGSRVIDLLKQASNYITDHQGIGLITAHRSKGLEFDDVVVAADFNINSADECNVMYVALTRAKRTLSVSPLLVNYMFQKHTKLKFPFSAKHTTCSICKRRKPCQMLLIEDDTNVVLNNQCEMYIEQSICSACI